MASIFGAKVNGLEGKKIHQKSVELDNKTNIISVNYRNQPDLTLSCDRTDVDWPAVEKHDLGYTRLAIYCGLAVECGVLNGVSSGR